MTTNAPRVAPELIRATNPELVEAITHLTFYAGWPAGVTATTVLAGILGEQTETEA
ncbi:MAG: hypothetical protein QM626_03400 [Microbacterium sp.]|uniref:hypothetical protein n=1 Tax=Microbacterium sp. TaxID=51671 RepID=UPI0039E2997E